jgi:hypothetical protein
MDLPKKKEEEKEYQHPCRCGAGVWRGPRMACYSAVAATAFAARTGQQALPNAMA